jgi:mono/diheme cytochrome c family protein
MAKQPRAEVYGPSALFPDGAAMQTPPEGTVARDQASLDQALDRRPAMTPELLARGRDRYQVFCQPCHDPSGSGRGVVPARGFPQPPSYHSQALLQAPTRHFVDVMTHGYGVMYSYADRIPPADRWAIAAYIRALQLSQRVPADKLTPQERQKLGGADGR